MKSMVNWEFAKHVCQEWLLKDTSINKNAQVVVLIPPDLGLSPTAALQKQFQVEAAISEELCFQGSLLAHSGAGHFYRIAGPVYSWCVPKGLPNRARLRCKKRTTNS